MKSNPKLQTLYDIAIVLWLAIQFALFEIPLTL